MPKSFARFQRADRPPRRAKNLMILVALITAAMLAVMPAASAADSPQPAANADSAKSEQPPAQEPVAQEPVAQEPAAEKPAVEEPVTPQPAARQLVTNDQADDHASTKQPRSPKPDADDQAKEPRAPKEPADDRQVVTDAEPNWTDATCDNLDPNYSFGVNNGVTYSDYSPAPGNVDIGDTVTVTGTINDPANEMFPDGTTEKTWSHTFDAPEGCEDPEFIDAPNGDLPVNDPCGPDNATWILPEGDDVPANFTWKVAEDGLLTAEANDGYYFDIPRQEMAQKEVEYGYAPDSGKPCLAADDPKDFCDLLPGIQGKDDLCATPPSEKAGFIPTAQTDPPAETDLVADQPAPVNGALPNTGGPDVMAGLLAMALLGIGGTFVMTARMRRRA